MFDLHTVKFRLRDIYRPLLKTAIEFQPNSSHETLIYLKLWLYICFSKSGIMAKVILVVEDYEDARGYMRHLLEECGYDVIEAVDGIEAVEFFKKSHPDLILMDISLPVVDGLTATKAIRQSPQGKEIPIIAITAFSNLYLEKALEAGCNELIGKPFDIDSLEIKIKNYLEHQLAEPPAR